MLVVPLVPGADDQDLLTRWQQGDGKAGNELIARQFPRLKRFFARKTSDREAIEELLQQTFHRCVKKLDAFEGRSTFDTFIYGIARNVLLEYYRERRRSDRVEAIESMPVVDLEPGPFVAAEGKQERKILINALRRLSLDTQILVELYFFEDMTGTEICNIVGVTEGQFRGRIRAARRDLQRHIEELVESPELLKSTQMTLVTWARKIQEHLPSDGD